MPSGVEEHKFRIYKPEAKHSAANAVQLVVRPPPADQPGVRRHRAYPPVRHRMRGVPQGAHLVPRPPAGDARAPRLG